MDEFGFDDLDMSFLATVSTIETAIASASSAESHALISKFGEDIVDDDDSDI